MRNEELIKLRGQILNDIVPLVIDNADDGPDRFGLLLRIIQAGDAKAEVYKHAYASAKKIEDKSEQLNALLSLVDEIDFDTPLPSSEDVDGDVVEPVTPEQSARENNDYANTRPQSEGVQNPSNDQ